MTMIQCPTHGLEFIATCCEHVADAEEAKRFERADVVLNDWGEPALLCQGCRERALRYIEEAKKSSSRDPVVEFGWHLEPICYECMSAWYAATGQGNYLDAVLEQREQAVVERPDSPGAHFHLGWDYLRRQQYAEATQALETAVRLRPQNAMFLMRLGEAYAGVGQKQKAREALTRARDTALAQSNASFVRQIDEHLSKLG